LGKGIRTGARDALLSDESTHANKGKVFGFHRSMDTVGAVIGPALALVFLYFNPGNYIYLFYLAFIPGILSVLATFFLKESNKSLSKKISRVRFSELVSYWKSSPALYKKVSAGLLFFTLFNSSDIFLLLMVKQAGMTDTFVIGVYIFYNLVYALFAYQAGRLADKIGLKKVLIFGFTLFAIVYTGMALSQHIYIYLLLFALYGIYAAATEGISKAWISNISSKEDTATAIGTYAGFQSIFAMPASVIAGFLWFNFGAGVAFGTTAVMTLVVVIYFALLKEY
jgi:MFS family permease